MSVNALLNVYRSVVVKPMRRAFVLRQDVTADAR
jgi:hypothetical protein